MLSGIPHFIRPVSNQAIKLTIKEKNSQRATRYWADNFEHTGGRGGGGGGERWNESK